MINKRKTLLVIIMIFSLLLTCVAYAETDSISNNETVEEGVYSDIMPLFTYIFSCSASVNINNGTASCTAKVIGNSSSLGYASIYMELQRYNTSTKTWTKYASWQSVANNYRLTLSKTKAVTSGKYRIKANVTVNTETTTIYSDTATK